MTWWSQDGDFVLTQRWVWTLTVLITSISILRSVSKLLENINDKFLVLGISFLAVLFCIAMTQWSAYVTHKKKHAEDELGTEKFAVIPYLVVPLLGALVTTILAALGVDIAIGHGYICGDTEDITVVTVIFDIILWCLADYYLVSHVGDAVYYQTIESKVADAAKSALPSDTSKEELIKLLAEAILKK